MFGQQVVEVHRGDKVRLTEVPGNSAYDRYNLCAGDLGTVDCVDSLGTVHIKWTKGQRVGIIAEHRGLLERVSR